MNIATLKKEMNYRTSACDSTCQNCGHAARLPKKELRCTFHPSDFFDVARYMYCDEHEAPPHVQEDNLNERMDK